ncbi:hypothetical protein V1511DRAFT_510494 [Dipodascopsis uninucleata]
MRSRAQRPPNIILPPPVSFTAVVVCEGPKTSSHNVVAQSPMLSARGPILSRCGSGLAVVSSETLAPTSLDVTGSTAMCVPEAGLLSGGCSTKRAKLLQPATPDMGAYTPTNMRGPYTPVADFMTDLITPNEVARLAYNKSLREYSNSFVSSNNEDSESDASSEPDTPLLYDDITKSAWNRLEMSIVNRAIDIYSDQLSLVPGPSIPPNLLRKIVKTVQRLVRDAGFDFLHSSSDIRRRVIYELSTEIFIDEDKSGHKARGCGLDTPFLQSVKDFPVQSWARQARASDIKKDGSLEMSATESRLMFEYTASSLGSPFRENLSPLARPENKRKLSKLS